MAICFASVNGQWTNWSRWSRCSRTCNGGTRSRRRSCTNPPPSNGGALCSGPGSQSQFCGRIPCQFIGVWILSLQFFYWHFFVLILSSLRRQRRDVGNLSIPNYLQYLFIYSFIYQFICFYATISWGSLNTLVPLESMQQVLWRGNANAYT